MAARPVVASTALTVVVLLGVPSAHSVTCRNAKLKAMAKREGGLLGCRSKVAATGDASRYPSCQAKVVTKFALAFAKAGNCAGTQTQCEGVADRCDSAIAALLTGTSPSSCEAAELRAAGNLASREVFCSTLGKPNSVDCTAGAERAYGRALNRARDCPAGGFVQTEIENNCVYTAIGPRFEAICALTVCPGGTFVTAWGGTFGVGDGFSRRFLGVAVDGGGNVFVGDAGNNRIQKFDNNGTFLTEWGTPGTGNGQFGGDLVPYAPLAVAVDGGGNVFVADPGNNRVQKFDNSGSFLTAWGTFGTANGQFSEPIGVAVDGSGNVFVVDNGNYRVEKFDNNGSFLAAWGTSGTGDGQFEAAFDVAVDGGGNVFVTDINNPRIQKFDNTGTFLTAWGGFGNPDGVAVDGSGNVLVTDDVSVQKFDNDGTFVTAWGTYGTESGHFNGASGLAVDGSGNVFVLDDFNNRIQKFACP